MTLSSTDKRELCVAHGWVGRAAFQRDRHDLCVDPAAESVDDDEVADEEISSDLEEELPEVETDEDPDEEPLRWSRASARRRGIPPKKTLAVRRITQADLAAARVELRVLGADQPYDRPKTRGDCASVRRPCPFVACSMNLYLDASETGSIILNFPHLEPGQMPADQSCALDLADQGNMTLEEIAVVTNLTRERIRQIELKALLRRARPAAIALGLGADDAASVGAGRHVSPGADLAETGIDGELPSDVASILVGGKR